MYNRTLKRLMSEKYDQHCAYCGSPVTKNSVYIDLIVPERFGGTTTIDNMNPACSRCYAFKNGDNVETFRGLLMDMSEDLARTSARYELLLRHGIITENANYHEFYFEKLNRSTKNASVHIEKE